MMITHTPIHSLGEFKIITSKQNKINAKKMKMKMKREVWKEVKREREREPHDIIADRYTTTAMATAATDKGQQSC